MTSAVTQLFGALDQAKQRRGEFFRDQHGRNYSAWVENKTGEPTGGINHDQWTAPTTPLWCRGRLVPDTKYMKIVRTRGPAAIEIDYAQWLADWDEADAMWRAGLKDLISKMQVDLQTMAKLRANPPLEVLEVIGKGPGERRPRQFIEAAMKGNKWALGQSDIVPTWAKPILDAWELLQPHETGIRYESQAEYPDEDDQADDATDTLLALEEQYDPEAMGGKREPIPQKAGHKKPKAKPLPE